MERPVVKGQPPSVNVKAWAIESVAQQGCQERVDTKAFTGRGSLFELRHLVDKLELVEREMGELSTLSKKGGLDVYVMLHRRAKTGYVFLRWREVGGAKRHLAWDVIEERTAGLHVQARGWVRQVTQRAQQLNDGHLRVRDALTRVRREMLERSPPVFMRTST
ncbi:MAG TPA: hypothetical protein VMS38_19055 [Pseudorhodoferax sp.]|nr:hypothetical protein [Pseudorhodoferax sp.]